jgi:hypothetical protein
MDRWMGSLKTATSTRKRMKRVKRGMLALPWRTP